MALCGIRRHYSEEIRKLSRVVVVGLEGQTGFGHKEWRGSQQKGQQRLGDRKAWDMYVK